MSTFIIFLFVSSGPHQQTEFYIPKVAYSATPTMVRGCILTNLNVKKWVCFEHCTRGQNKQAASAG